MQKHLAAVLPLCFLALVGCAGVKSSQGQEGAEGGPCYPNGTCDSGLVCLSDTCVAPVGGTGGIGGDGGNGGGGNGGGGNGGGGNGGGGGACDYGLEPDFYAECMAESCCTELDACFADDTCVTCVTISSGPECETNTQVTALLACQGEACPLSFCGSAVGFFGANDPIACNKCIDAECCAPFDACAGGVDQPDLEACLACLDDPSGATCQSAPADTQAAAVAFAACTDTSCGTPCAE